MANEDHDFLRSGLLHYPQAARTVERFTQMIYARLEKGLARRWPSDEKCRHNDGVDGEETYIEAWRRVKLNNGEEATVSIGLGWGRDGNYSYAYCSEGPDWAKRPTGPGFERDRSYNILSRPCDREYFDIDEAIDAILLDFERALRSSAPAAATSAGA